VIDLHCHVLPGIDDGPATIESSIALARAATAAGTRTLVATPHVSWTHANDAATIARLAEELSARLAAEGVALEIRPGAEIAVTRVLDIEPGELLRLGLGGGPWLLVEPPFAGGTAGLEGVVRGLQERGHRIVLAHPERCQAFHSDPGMLGALVDDGALTSVTAGSLVGQFGESVRRFALRLAQDELIHNVASDAHDAVKRPPAITAPIEQAGLGALREWLTEDVPAAILSGAETIPRRPSIALAQPGRVRQPWWRRATGLTRAS
jgi:protein-tyrosine phosphatase